MNKRHYEHTLPNIRGSLSNTYVVGYFRPEEWTDSKSGEKRDRVIMVATRFYPTPEKEEEKPDQPKKKVAPKKKKATK